jgi:carbon-monoxide dehydrogenase medium subunit
MQDFDYIRVSEIAEAISILSREGNEAAVFCGGTDLLVQLGAGQRKARLLVDIKSIPEVNELKLDPVEGLILGSAVSCFRICSDPVVALIFPGLIDAVSLIGGVQIQGRASVGGNLCNASPAADTIPALIVHCAVCVIAGPNGYRKIPVENFCTAPGQNVVQRGEFLVSLHIPPPPTHFGAHYLRFTPRNEMDIAVAGAGAAVVLDQSLKTIGWARIALGAVAPTPLLVETAGEYLTGRDISAEMVLEAVRLAQEAVHPIQDPRGTVPQRQYLVGVLTRRALAKAIERAIGKEE